MSELLAKAISEKPDVLVVHNPTVQLLARQIKQAESQGIKVLQLNLQSNQPSNAFVGANWTRIGNDIAEDIVKECGAGSGKSGKVAIIPGQLTAADSVMMNDAAFKVFKEHPENQRRLPTSLGLGTREGTPDHRHRAAAESRPVRHFRPLGRHTIGAGNAVKDPAGRQRCWSMPPAAATPSRARRSRDKCSTASGARPDATARAATGRYRGGHAASGAQSPMAPCYGGIAAQDHARRGRTTIPALLEDVAAQHRKTLSFTA